MDHTFCAASYDLRLATSVILDLLASNDERIFKDVAARKLIPIPILYQKLQLFFELKNQRPFLNIKFVVFSLLVLKKLQTVS